jgi:hypothetical protein
MKLTSLEASRLPKTYISSTEYKEFYFMAQKARAKSWDPHGLRRDMMQ